MHDEIQDFLAESRFVKVVAWLSLAISIINFAGIYIILKYA